MISRQLDDALYRLKIVVLTRLADRVGSRLTAVDIEQQLLSGKSPGEIAKVFKNYPQSLLKRTYRKWVYGRSKMDSADSPPMLRTAAQANTTIHIHSDQQADHSGIRR